MAKRKSAKVIVKLHKKALNAPDGRKIVLEPLIEEIGGAFVRGPDSLSKKMGIEFLPDKVEARIFDKKGFEKAVQKREGSESNLDRGGEFFPETGDIFLDAEKALSEASEGVNGLCGVEKNPHAYSRFVDHIFRLNLIAYFYHELVHLNHCLYKPEIFEEIVAWNRSAEKNKNGELRKGFLQRIREFPSFSRVLNNLTIVEGVAVRVTSELMKELPGFSEGLLKCEVRKFDEEPSRFEKVEAFLEDQHMLGEWFVATVANLVKVNPIRLVIDNPPLTLSELFNPERYVRRLSKDR